MFEGVATADTCTHSTSTACTSLGRHCNTTHPRFGASGIEKERYCPLLVGVSTKTRIRDGSVLMDQRWLEWVNQLLAALEVGNPGEKICDFNYPAAAKKFKAATHTL